MDNKNVGYLILGISAVITVIVLLFNSSATQLASDCPTLKAGFVCPAHDALRQEIYLSLSIVGLLVIIGLILIFSKPEQKIIIKRIKDNVRKKEIDMSELKSEEKQVLKLIIEQKAMFQADLIEKSNLGKVKVSRILDKLEARGIIERKRRGMNNLIVLKD